MAKVRAISHDTWLCTSINAESREKRTWNATTIRSHEPALKEVRLYANIGGPTAPDP